MSRPPPKAGTVEEDLPPPYSSTTGSPLQSHQTVHTDGLVSPQYAPGIPGLLSSHLSNLHDRLVAEEARRSDTRDHLDSQALSLIVPYIEDLLSEIATLRPTPASVEATLVPDRSVDRHWIFSDPTEKGHDEIRSVIRVQGASKVVGDRKVQLDTPARPSLLTRDLSPESPREFSSWGRWDEEDGANRPSNANAGLWWSDESMARRLAASLQPAVKVDRVTVRQQVEQQKGGKEKKTSRLSGLLRRDVPVPLREPRANPPSREEESDDVTMRVRAEEVTFRRENEMGIWESKTGWGLVVKVSINRPRA